MDQNTTPRTIPEDTLPEFNSFETELDDVGDLWSFSNQSNLYKLASADTNNIHYDLSDARDAFYGNNHLPRSASLAECEVRQQCPPSDPCSESVTDNASVSTGVTTSSNNPADSLCDVRVKGRNGRAPSDVSIKKREKERKLESTEKEIEKAHRDLSACAEDLTQQVHKLKMDLLQHVDCDCVLIQKYIASEARRYVSEYQGTRSH
ncbi:hypothetical protein FHETE_4197 [Fusarium heterosporum]|uniref:BZIP domain-containing protein n=1 Tax=Fusarium heterosporum TaxID=42747 RepID=A0A8H5TMN6_FUSHE|nr:hypothetical protein FHETE_4197 [Fusarium heterosporum]